MNVSLFPHERVRPVQQELIQAVEQCLSEKKHLIVHAPTGLGKTAAALAPCLKLALERDVHVFFLTSRHTQHHIVLETLKLMKQKYGLAFLSTSIIGKQWLCAQPNVQTLRSNDFHAYCRALREDHQCKYYENIKAKTNPAARRLFAQLETSAPNTTEYVLAESKSAELCPYEMSLLLAAKSKIIVTDYYYLLNPKIRESFLKKTNKKLENAIIVIDEGHNLPSRARELMTQKISNFTIKKALKEAKKYGFDDIIPLLNGLQDILAEATAKLQNYAELRLRKDLLVQAVAKLCEYEEFIARLENRADDVREQQKQSALGTIATFLEQWQGPDAGFIRYAVRKDPIIGIVYRCLDPSLLTKELIASSYSTILMSGTLTPTNMYKDLLGFPANTVERVFPSPFATQNRLVLVVPKTTTKYSLRTPAQFSAIANVCADIVEKIPGHLAIYFPSYAVRDAVNNLFATKCTKTLFCEQPGMSKQQKQEFLERFTAYKEAVLLGVAAGSFGEGIDLPGVLKGVIIVGLPLERPNLETQELIQYYDDKFGRGWDYGYVLPALTKCLQNAGRCIRSETDRGVIVFLDERYAWPRYLGCIPKDWNAQVTTNYAQLINSFFTQL